MEPRDKRAKKSSFNDLPPRKSRTLQTVASARGPAVETRAGPRNFCLLGCKLVADAEDVVMMALAMMLMMTTRITGS